jgi:adenosylhomocysteine nucleosidase
MILLLTPLAIEYDLLKEFLTEGGWRGHIETKGPLTGIMFKDPAVYLTIGGHGKTQFGIQTQFLIHQFPQVKNIFCIGAAGSLTDSVKPGDLVIATKTIEHDYNLKFIKKPLPEFLCDP